MLRYATERVKYAFLTITSNLLKELKSNVENADNSAEKTLRMVEFLTMIKELDGIKQKLDSIDGKIDGSSVPHELAASRNRDAILLALKPHLLNQRVDEIKETHPETFEWVFSTSSDESFGPHKGADAIAFPTWLRSGSGFFHISGKPGSGKSTLMKFLTTHVDTQKYLEEWAASANKQLIHADFFIWKLGFDEQKTMKGLLRGLLFKVAEDHPEIMEMLFPEHWNPDLYVTTTSGSLNITHKDARAAFQRLLTHPDISQRYKVCLFIDGLDEFDDEDVSHWGLTEALRKWPEEQGTTEKSARTELKLCVSSREDEPIMKGLPSSQRITLHELTADDISILVRNTLGRNEYFQGLHQRDQTGCDDLISSIVTDAEGVFLWVTLLLKEMEDVLPSSGTSVRTLQCILRTTPKKLEQYLQKILDSIPKHFRPGANFVLAMALRMTGLHISIDNRFSKAERGRNDKQFIEPVIWNPALSLFGLSYVLDAFENADLAHCDFDWSIPKSVTVEDVEKATRTSVDRLKIWCNNLMDSIPRQQAMSDVKSSLCVTFHDQFAQFTHRSVPEFLISVFRRDPEALTFDDDDVAAGILAVSEAETRAGPTLWSTATLPNGKPDRSTMMELEIKLVDRLQHILSLVRLRPISRTSVILPMLDKLEDARTESLVHHFQPRDTRYGYLQGFVYGMTKTPGQYQSLEWDERSTVVTHAAATGLFEYIHWKLENDPSFVKNTARLYSTLCGVSVSILKHGCSPTGTSVLRLLLEAGAPYDVKYRPDFPGYGMRKDFSIWQLFDNLELDDDGIDVEPHSQRLRPNSPWNIALKWYIRVVKDSMILGRKRARATLEGGHKLTPDFWTSLEVWLEFGARPPFGDKGTEQPLVAGVRHHQPPNTQKLSEYLL